MSELLGFLLERRVAPQAGAHLDLDVDVLLTRWQPRGRSPVTAGMKQHEVVLPRTNSDSAGRAGLGVRSAGPPG
jgi:hypothetical protein